jgi:predicted  nucleic acid-binding Zn-ribbon protein
MKPHEKLGVAIADAGYAWTPEMRSAWEELDRQQDRIAELEKGLELVKDAYCARDSECRQLKGRIAELEKDLALKTRDRDVFRDFTLAYEKRIEELEKVIQDGMKAFGEIQDQRLKDKFETPQTKPLSDEEIDEILESLDVYIDTHAGVKLFVKAIEERHGIK